jgi:hypothetical protein
MDLGLLKVVHPLKIYHNTNFYGPTLIGASFVATSKIRTAAIFNGCSYGIKTVVSWSPSTSLLNFVKMYQMIQKLMGELTQAG